MDKKWIKAKELAKLWGLSSRRVNQLCKENLLPGAYKEGKFWMIPSDVEKPENTNRGNENPAEFYKTVSGRNYIL